jgi:hypothetical protein
VVDYALRGGGVGLVDMHALDWTSECDFLGLILRAGAGISGFAPDGIWVTGKSAIAQLGLFWERVLS